MFTRDGLAFDGVLDSLCSEYEYKDIPIADISPQRNACVVYFMPNGATGVLIGARYGKCNPTHEQESIARDLCLSLNTSHAYEGGQWKLAWVNPEAHQFDIYTGLLIPDCPTELCIAYYDKDEDAQFTVNIEDSAYAILNAGYQEYIDACEQAYLEVKALKKKAGIIEGVHTYKRAKGEKPVSQRYM